MSIKYFSLLLFFGCIQLPGFSQTRFSRSDYVETYYKIAVREMKLYSIPASITLAQGILESDCGNSYLAKLANNHFGIKSHNWTGDYVLMDDDKKNEKFRKYKDADESFVDHSKFLAEQVRYFELFKLKLTDYKGWAYGLQKAGYATSPTYAERLIKIIEEEQLFRFDYGDETKETIKKEMVVIHNGHEVETYNKTRYITIKEGDTMMKLHQELGMRGWELPAFNDLHPGIRLYPGDRLYIEKKSRRAAAGNEKYTVIEGESMWSISQKYAIRLSRLYYLNRMKDGEEPFAGDVLNLRKRK